MQIAEGCTQAAFVNQTGIPRDILITILPEVNAVIMAAARRDSQSASS
jgi:hypothetical protein